jgi:hypothetical protein
MDDRSWMYWDSLEWLQNMNYCNGIEGFINYTLFNPKILVDVILDIHIRGVKIKRGFWSTCYNNASSTKKGFMEKYSTKSKAQIMWLE